MYNLVWLRIICDAHIYYVKQRQIHYCPVISHPNAPTNAIKNVIFIDYLGAFGHTSQHKIESQAI